MTAHMLSESKTNGERLWFKPPTQAQTSEQEYSDLTASNRRPSTPYSRNTTQGFSRGTQPCFVNIHI